MTTRGERATATERVLGFFWFGFGTKALYWFFFLINTVLVLVCFAFALYRLDCISVLGFGFLCFLCQ